jgi:hypothetical protein
MHAFSTHVISLAHDVTRQHGMETIKPEHIDSTVLYLPGDCLEIIALYIYYPLKIHQNRGFRSSEILSIPGQARTIYLRGARPSPSPSRPASIAARAARAHRMVHRGPSFRRSRWCRRVFSFLGTSGSYSGSCVTSLPLRMICLQRSMKTSSTFARSCEIRHKRCLWDLDKEWGEG